MLTREIREGRLESRVVRGFYLRPEWVLEEPRPSTLRIAEELGVIGR